MFFSSAICTLVSGGTTARTAWGSTISVRVWVNPKPRARAASAWPSGTVLMPPRTLEITYAKDRVNAGEVLAAIQGGGFGIVDVSTKEPDLEDVFLSLTRAANA